MYICVCISCERNICFFTVLCSYEPMPMTNLNQSVAVLSSLASEDEEERQDDDDVVSDDEGLFPSIIIITLFSAAGVPSTGK